MNKKYLYLIISILLLFSYYSILSMRSACNYYVKSEKREAVTKNILNNLNSFYPGIGEGANEIIESMLDDNYKMEKSKILDPLIEEKTKVMIKLHGLKNYNLRYPNLRFPVRDKDLNNAFIIDEFRYRENGKFHTGIDIQLFNGSDIGSAGDGVVRYIGESELYGKMIIIRHYIADGYIDSYYGHLFNILVKKDQVVGEKQLIAKMGQTGTQCTGKHLHFELRYYVKVGDKYKLMHLNPVDNSTWNYKVTEKYLDI